MDQITENKRAIPAGYKLTEVGVIPEDWRQIALGDAVTFQRGFDLPQKNRKAGNIPVVSSAGITDHHSVSAVEPPGIITGRYGTIGEVFFVQEAFWPLNTTLFVKDFHGNDPRFIYYALQRFDFASFSGKSGVPGVNRNDLHAENVVFPRNINEQRAIAAALSDVDALLNGLDRLIAKKRGIKQATMQQLLTGQTRLPGFEERWKTKTLDEVVTFLSGGTPSKNNENYWNGDIPWISATSLRTFFIWRSDSNVTNEAVAAGR